MRNLSGSGLGVKLFQPDSDTDFNRCTSFDLYPGAYSHTRSNTRSNLNVGPHSSSHDHSPADRGSTETRFRVRRDPSP